jgi:hypothetical protein
MTTLLAPAPLAPTTPDLPLADTPPADPPDDRAARVARGARFWDELQAGWEWVIDLEQFDMRDCDLCVLGQLRGYFYRVALEMSGFPPRDGMRAWVQFEANPEACRWAHDRGFYDDFEDPDDEDFSALRRLWVAAIHARRGTAAGARP